MSHCPFHFIMPLFPLIALAALPLTAEYGRRLHKQQPLGLILITLIFGTTLINPKPFQNVPADYAFAATCVAWWLKALEVVLVGIGGQLSLWERVVMWVAYPDLQQWEAMKVNTSEGGRKMRINEKQARLDAVLVIVQGLVSYVGLNVLAMVMPGRPSVAFHQLTGWEYWLFIEMSKQSLMMRYIKNTPYFDGEYFTQMIFILQHFDYFFMLTDSWMGNILFAWMPLCDHGWADWFGFWYSNVAII